MGKPLMLQGADAERFEPAYRLGDVDDRGIESLKVIPTP